MPSCTVTVRSAGTPSATSIWRIASDAAMKQSTWRCFQRENELLAQVKVDAPRGDQRAAPLGRCVAAERQRQRRHGDAVRDRARG